MTKKYKSSRKSTNTRKYKSTRKQIGGSPTSNSTNGSDGYMAVEANILENNSTPNSNTNSTPKPKSALKKGKTIQKKKKGVVFASNVNRVSPETYSNDNSQSNTDSGKFRSTEDYNRKKELIKIVAKKLYDRGVDINADEEIQELFNIMCPDLLSKLMDATDIDFYKRRNMTENQLKTYIKGRGERKYERLLTLEGVNPKFKASNYAKHIHTEVLIDYFNNEIVGNDELIEKVNDLQEGKLSFKEFCNYVEHKFRDENNEPIYNASLLTQWVLTDPELTQKLEIRRTKQRSTKGKPTRRGAMKGNRGKSKKLNITVPDGESLV